MLKATTVERYNQWCETAKSKDTFRWEGSSYTKAEFNALHFGGEANKPAKTINTTIDIKETDYEDMEPAFDSGDTDID
tara:strand:+ start:848 stop:1081 length:234 start_codon:yes stop_codon:yes gene_type:complete